MQKDLLLALSLGLSLMSTAQNNPYRSDVVWFVSPDRPEWVYRLGQTAQIDIRVTRYGMPLHQVSVRYSLGLECMPAHTTGTVVLQQGQASLSVPGLDAPGFLSCQFEIEHQGQHYTHHINLGYEPERLVPYTVRPTDFDLFWDSAAARAQQCPLVVESEYVPEFSTPQVACHLVKVQAVEPRHFFYGYLTAPRAPGKYPVVFSPPGAGIKPTTPIKDFFYAESGYIRFDMEIHGIRPNLPQEVYNEISQAFGQGNSSYLVNGIASKDTYYMRRVYLNCLRAIDYLCTLPQWDGRNLIAQGTSQGGALALVATALHPRVTACAVNHPALVDMAGYKAQRAGGYPHLFDRFQGLDNPAVLETLPYFDVCSFLHRVRVPVFMSWGYNDPVCPPTTSYIAYNLIQSPKQALITPATEHWISDETRRSILQWIATQIR